VKQREAVRRTQFPIHPEGTAEPAPFALSSAAATRARPIGRQSVAASFASIAYNSNTARTAFCGRLDRECNLSGTYCGHDALDWLAAIGPTLATFVTAGVAYSAYRGSERIQRLLVRPRLTIRHALIPAALSGAGPGYKWDIQLRNQGQSAARITHVAILLDGTEIAPDALELPGNYWGRILGRIGVTAGQDLVGWTVSTPETLGAGIELPIVSATLLGAGPAIQGVASRIELRVTYESAFGEHWVESSKTGEM
jgi:hypothetical protein